MHPEVRSETKYFTRLLDKKIVPWIKNRGIENIFIAQPSWEVLKRSELELPPGAFVTYKPIQGEKASPRRRLSYGKFSIEQHRWPEDRLLSARTPKLCFVTEGPVAFQIADYVLHCQTGHGILLPPGTPNPDGTLPILDFSREHFDRCEMLMVMPYHNSLNCWTSLQTFDENKKMKHKSVVISILQSLVTSYLHQLVDEANRRQLHWESICNLHLLTIALLLQREIKELPVIIGGDENFAEVAKNSSSNTHAITKAEEYINANLRWPLSIDQVARHVYMSRTGFIKQFRLRTGRTFTEYINDRRFEEVCKLLKGTDLAIEQIASLVGIKPRSLRLLVQQKTGLSPSALRQQYRQQIQKIT